MVVPPTTLDTLRNDLKQRRLNISQSNKFVPYIRLDGVVAEAICIGLYCPMGGEPDPWLIARNFAGLTSLPTLESATAGMIFRKWTHGDMLVKTSWGGQQPLSEATAVVPDVIFVPLLGYDLSLNRIGQGGGHYDRYLAANPGACRIGIAWEAQRLDAIDAQPWDVPLDAVLTEATFYVKDLTRCRNL